MGETAHEARQGELDAILETAHEAFISIDEDGRVRAWNREAERTFGFAKELAEGRLLRDLIIPPRFRHRHDEGMRRFLETGEGALLNKRVEITALHRSGREFPIELTISALRRGDSWTFNAFVHDISDRYRATELQSRLATLVEHSADAIVGRTREGVVTSWNPGAERLFGYGAAEMVGHTLDRLVPEGRAGEAARLLDEVVAGRHVQGVETTRRCRDGRLLDVSLTLSPIRDDAGRVTEISMIARDVTTRKQAERALAAANEELRRTNELKSRFVAVASHELRTPLTSVVGFAKTLRERWHQLDDAERLGFVEIIDEQSDRLARLVDDVLTISRIESGKMPIDVRPVDLAEVAGAALAELGLVRQVEVVLTGDPVAAADRNHVLQIVLNYVTNARKYGRPPVVVEVAGADSTVEICVVDAGDGVPEEFVPRLFDSFTQASGELVSQGSGLGLAIAKAFAELSRGEVWYEGRLPHGSLFGLRLPRYGVIDSSFGSRTRSSESAASAS